MKLRKSASALIVTFLLAGCASASSPYPSLTIGDRGRVSGTLPPASPTPESPVLLDGAAAGDLAAILTEARAAHEAFLAESENAGRIVRSARGAGEGSDGWTKAQVAIGSLESARSRTMISLGDLDRMQISAEVETAETDSLSSARDEVAALVDSEDSVIDGLIAELR